jgi:hypothetical protein
MSGKPIILAIAIALISGIIFVSGVIPPARIPVMHTLEIKALPAEGKTDSSISVLKINRAIRAPRPGGAEADLKDVTVTGRYRQDADGIHLEEGATLAYSSFYSGCITVHFGTSPDAGQVLVRFDEIEEKFSLASAEPSSTIVDLCSPLPWRGLSLKWQAILLLIYFADLVSILTLTGLGVAALYYLGFNKNLRFQEILRSGLVALSVIALITTTDLQIRRILFFPNETATNAPPARPSSAAGPLTFTTIYQQSLHTKRFAHSFILMFMDVYPKLDAVYIHEATWKSFNFRSTQFEEWFAPYHMQSADQMPRPVSQEVVDQLIDEQSWSYHEMILDDQGKTMRLNYLTTKESFVLVANRGYDFYLLPGSLIEGVAGGPS